MRYRIREEGSAAFYTERWHEPYGQWVAAMHCRFDSLEDAQEGIEIYHKNYLAWETESTVIHDYEPRGKFL